MYDTMQIILKNKFVAKCYKFKVCIHTETYYMASSRLFILKITQHLREEEGSLNRNQQSKLKYCF